MENKRNIFIKEVDRVLQNWTQGDYVLGEHWFVYRYNIDQPLTETSEDTAEQKIDLAEEEVKGFVVVTQTCDIVRSCKSRPFVEVVPLVEVDEQKLLEIKKARRPHYAYIPSTEKDSLVADLRSCYDSRKTSCGSMETSTRLYKRSRN